MTEAVPLNCSSVREGAPAQSEPAPAEVQTALLRGARLSDRHRGTGSEQPAELGRGTHRLQHLVHLRDATAHHQGLVIYRQGLLHTANCYTPPRTGMYGGQTNTFQRGRCARTGAARPAADRSAEPAVSRPQARRHRDPAA